ncbi:MAG: hypothetical protein A2017_00030 [Lentisphaerae bacterium GWF2_44_16]|nr:MAG: hypothetical protein A2017_00030 [Lentisphaerae bacterium GWF2_44_16]
MVSDTPGDSCEKQVPDKTRNSKGTKAFMTTGYLLILRQRQDPFRPNIIKFDSILHLKYLFLSGIQYVITITRELAKWP